MADRRKDYRVGFCKPPEEYRFQPGKSGNSKGRPRKSEVLDHPVTSPLEDELLRLVDESVPLQTPEGTKLVTRQEILASQLLKLAMKGDNFNAMKLAFQVIASAQIKKVQEKVISVETALDYKRACEEFISHCVAAGEEPPLFVPHPADMIISPLGVEYLGPVTEAQHAAMMLVVEERDSILNVVPGYAELAPEHDVGSPAYLAYQSAIVELDELNALLPPRLRAKPAAPVSILAWGKLRREELKDNAVAPNSVLQTGASELAGSEKQELQEDKRPLSPTEQKGQGLPPAVERRVLKRNGIIAELRELKRTGAHGPGKAERSAVLLRNLGDYNALLPPHLRQELEG